MSISDFSFDFNFDSDSNNDDEPQQPPSLKVVIADADSIFGVHATRAFLKNHDGSKVAVAALVENTDSKYAREIKSLGSKLIKYSHSDTNSIRDALNQSGAPTLVLISPATHDLVIRVNALLSQVPHTQIRSVYLWSFVGTDHAMLLPPECLPNNGNSLFDRPVPNSLTLLKEAEELVIHALPKHVHHTILRSGFPLQTFLYLSNLIQNRGAIPFTSDSAHVAPIDSFDVGRAICRLFHLGMGGIPEDRRGSTITLTGVEAQSGPMLVTTANAGLSQPLAFAKVSMDDMRAFLSQTHISPFDLSLVLGWWQLFTDNRLQIVTSDLQDILGGPDKLCSVSDFFSDHANKFLPRVERIPGDWNSMFSVSKSNCATLTTIFDDYMNAPRLSKNTATNSFLYSLNFIRDVRLENAKTSSQSSSNLNIPSVMINDVLLVGESNDNMTKLRSMNQMYIADANRGSPPCKSPSSFFRDLHLRSPQEHKVLPLHGVPDSAPLLNRSHLKTSRTIDDRQDEDQIMTSILNLALFDPNLIQTTLEYGHQIANIVSLDMEIAHRHMFGPIVQGVLKDTKSHMSKSPVCDSPDLTTKHKIMVQKAAVQMEMANDLLATVLSTLSKGSGHLENVDSRFFPTHNLVFGHLPFTRTLQHVQDSVDPKRSAMHRLNVYTGLKSTNNRGGISDMVLHDIGLNKPSCGKRSGETLLRDRGIVQAMVADVNAENAKVVAGTNGVLPECSIM